MTVCLYLTTPPLRICSIEHRKDETKDSEGYRNVIIIFRIFNLKKMFQT